MEGLGAIWKGLKSAGRTSDPACRPFEPAGRPSETKAKKNPACGVIGNLPLHGSCPKEKQRIKEEGRGRKGRQRKEGKKGRDEFGGTV